MAQQREEQQPKINLDYVLRTLPTSNESVSRVNAFFQGWEYENNPKLDLGLPESKLDVGLTDTDNQVTFKKVNSYLDPSRPSTSRLSMEEKEFQTVERHFQKMTLSLSHYISSIDFVTNPALQQKFDAKKEEFKYNGLPHEEVWAYHGTKPSNILSICKYNLNSLWVWLLIF